MNKKIVMIIVGVVLLISSLLIGDKFIYFMFFIYANVFLYSFITVKNNHKSLTGIYWIDKPVVEKGDEVNVTYKVYNEKIFPIPYLEIKDEVPAGLHKEGRIGGVHFLSPYECIKITKKLKCNRRGNYELGNLQVQIGDIFGFITRKAIVKDSIHLTVYPKVRPIEKFAITGRESFGKLSSTQKYNEDYSSIKDIRKYQPGDSMKRINWKVSAKKGELHVKNYDYSSKVNIQVYLDFQLDKYYHDKEALVEEKAVECCVSIINHALKQSIDTTLITYTDKKIKLHGKDIERFHDFLELATDIKPKSKVNTGDLISNEGKLLSLESTIIVITPLIDPKMYTSLLLLNKRGYALIVIQIGSGGTSWELESLKKQGVKTYKIKVDDDINLALR